MKLNVGMIECCNTQDDGTVVVHLSTHTVRGRAVKLQLTMDRWAIYDLATKAAAGARARALKAEEHRKELADAFARFIAT